MGSLNINFADVDSGNFEPLPEGLYQVIVDRVEVRESKSSDNNYFNWELIVQDEEYEDRRLWMITSLSPKALFRLKDVFEALGVLEDELELEWDDDIDVTPGEGPMLLNPDVLGLACTAVVKNEVYEGKERNKVDEIRPAGEDDAPKSKSKAKVPAKKTPARRGRAALR